VIGELKDITKGDIVKQKQCKFHNPTMAHDVFRVSLARLLPGCTYLDQPYQPHNVETQSVCQRMQELGLALAENPDSVEGGHPTDNTTRADAVKPW
jgi:hypothetical protein